MGGLSSLLQGLTGQQIRQGTQPTNQQQSNTMGGLNLGGIMSMLGGMGMNMPPQPNNNRPPQQQSTSQSNQQPPTQPQQQPTQQMPHVHGPGCNHQHAPQPSQQPPQQFPQIDLSNLASMANMFLNPQQQQQSSNQQSPSQQPSTQAQQPQNPMGSLMGMFSSLQQSGGMG